MFLSIDDTYNWVFLNHFYKIIKTDLWEWLQETDNQLSNKQIKYSLFSNQSQIIIDFYKHLLNNQSDLLTFLFSFN